MGLEGSFFEFAIGFVLQPELPLVIPLPTSLHSLQPAGVQQDPVCYTLRRLGRSIPSQQFFISLPQLFELFVHFLPNNSFRSEAICKFTVYLEDLLVKK
jgi:hypothetical protein